jgi:hypothetical protein
MTRHRRRASFLMLAAALATAGCNNNDTPTSATPSAEVTPITTPVSVSFPGAVGPGGSVSRTFAAQIPGTAVAVLSNISPATPLTIGLGVPRADGSGCLLSFSATAVGGASAQVSASVNVGTFCVQVFAPLQSADAVTFSVALTYP